MSFDDEQKALKAWEASRGPEAAAGLGRYAHAIAELGGVGTYHRLSDEEEDLVMLSLLRVERPRITLEELHQIPPLAVSSQHQLIRDLAAAGLGPVIAHHGRAA